MRRFSSSPTEPPLHPSVDKGGHLAIDDTGSVGRRQDSVPLGQMSHHVAPTIPPMRAGGGTGGEEDLKGPTLIHGLDGELKAKIFLPPGQVDRETLMQVAAICKHPAVKDARVMPDCHKGNGCCIGFTSPLQGCINPQLIGGDIGCGISAHPLPSSYLNKRNSAAKLKRCIGQSIPMGNGNECIHRRPIIGLVQYEAFLEEATKELHAFTEAYRKRTGVNLMDYIPPFADDGSWKQKVKPSELNPGEAEPEEEDEQEQEVEEYTEEEEDEEEEERSPSSGQSGKGHFPQRTVSSDDGSSQPRMHHSRSTYSMPRTTSVDTMAFLPTGPSMEEMSELGIMTPPSSPSRPGFRYSVAWMLHRLEQLGVNRGVFLRNMGTLGGGNHFIEVDRLNKAETTDGREPSFVSNPDSGETQESDLPGGLLVVHSGSRCLGQAIYKKWSASAIRLRDAAREQRRLEKEKEKAEGESSSDAEDNEDSEYIPFDDSLVLTKPEDIAGYYVDMILAQQVAIMNRTAMISLIIAELGNPEITFQAKDIVSSVHNYIDFHDLMIRKGAIRAAKGQPCIIAQNMRDGVWYCRGKGNPDWNGSAAHGCGRVQMRRRTHGFTQGGVQGKVNKKAVEALMAKFRAEMADVESDSIIPETLDERPSAYRSPALVRSMLEPDAVEILAHYRVFVSAKGA